VGFVILLLLAVLAAIVQHGTLATAPLAPDLPLALLAWAVVAGDERALLVRAWSIGLIRDVIDPGSVAFHTLAYFGLALAFLPLRQVVFHGRAAAWIGWAVMASLLLAILDRALGGIPLEASWLPSVTVACGTGATTLGIGWLFGGLPKALRPVGGPGA
jgi:hypothetical protein